LIPFMCYGFGVCIMKVSALHPHYKEQSLNAVYANNTLLFLKSYTIQ